MDMTALVFVSVLSLKQTKYHLCCYAMRFLRLELQTSSCAGLSWLTALALHSDCRNQQHECKECRQQQRGCHMSIQQEEKAETLQ